MGAIAEADRNPVLLMDPSPGPGIRGMEEFEG